MKKYLENWTLCGYHNYTPIQEKSMEMGVELCGVIPVVKAKVPCSVYEPLIENGIIPDPYFEVNSRSCEWVASRFWVYETEFFIKKQDSKRYRLVFEGLDCKCEIWFNNKKIAESDNMYVPVKVDVTDLICEKENKLKVMFYHAPDEMGQIGYTSHVKTQKARFSYKWDFSCRLPQIGIYRPVYIEEYEVFIDETDLRTDMYGNFAIKGVCEGDNENCIVGVVVYDGENQVYSSQKTVDLNGNFAVEGKVENVKLWWCNTYGEPNLYILKLDIIKNGKSIYSKSYNLGFKTLQVLPNDNATENSPNYKFVLNGTPVYIKGANLAPFDMLYGRITDEKIAYYVNLLKEMNVNLARVWGGGFIEKEYFYDLCDKEGILVWQDFIQSSSGIDNHPSSDEIFVAKFLDTVKTAVKEKRNHVCTAVFCGGNEIAVGEARTPVDEREYLTGLVANCVRENTDIHFVSTTPCGNNFAADFEHPENNHDVHAPWLYLGDVEHYKYGNNLQCLFHGEFGANGMSELSSLRKFLSKDNIGVFNFKENFVWRHHGELWDTYFRDKNIFGDNIKTVEDMIITSQFIQSEAVRYLIESNRRRAFANSGVMFWCFNEPFPNVSNTCFIDYYGNKKIVYYAIKRCYDNAYASMIYDKLVWKKGERLNVKPYVICPKGEYQLKIQVFADSDKKFEYIYAGFNSETDKVVYFDDLEIDVPECEGLNFIFEVNTSGKTYKNLITLLVADKNNFATIQPVNNFIDEIKRI